MGALPPIACDVAKTNTQRKINFCCEILPEKVQVEFCLGQESLSSDSKEEGTLCRWHMQRLRALLGSDEKKGTMKDEASDIKRPRQAEELRPLV